MSRVNHSEITGRGTSALIVFLAGLDLSEAGKVLMEVTMGGQCIMCI